MTKLKMMTASFLAVAAIASAVPASAAETYDKQSKFVSYKGLDLSSEKDQQRLQKRINYASKIVCGFYSARSLGEIADAQNCMKTARANADGKVQLAIANYKQNRQIAAREIVVGN